MSSILTFSEKVQMQGHLVMSVKERRRNGVFEDAVDDATGTTLALMGKQEGTEMAMRTL